MTLFQKVRYIVAFAALVDIVAYFFLSLVAFWKNAYAWNRLEDASAFALLIAQLFLVLLAAPLLAFFAHAIEDYIYRFWSWWTLLAVAYIVNRLSLAVFAWSIPDLMPFDWRMYPLAEAAVGIESVFLALFAIWISNRNSRSSVPP